MIDRPWRPLFTAPRDGTEVELTDGLGRVWEDCYLIVQHGGEEGWPDTATHWRPLESKENP